MIKKNHERQARALPSTLLEDTYNTFFKNERQATMSYAASFSVVQALQHYEIWDIDKGDEMEINEGDEMEIDDDQKEEKWQNAETFTFEIYMNDFFQIKPKPKPEEGLFGQPIK